MNEDDIQVGAIIVHRPTGTVYQVVGIGLARLPNGVWVRAAHYQPSGMDVNYYRPLSDFGNFTHDAP